MRTAMPNVFGQHLDQSKRAEQSTISPKSDRVQLYRLPLLIAGQFSMGAGHRWKRPFPTTHMARPPPRRCSFPAQVEKYCSGRIPAKKSTLLSRLSGRRCPSVDFTAMVRSGRWISMTRYRSTTMKRSFLLFWGPDTVKKAATMTTPISRQDDGVLL